MGTADTIPTAILSGEKMKNNRYCYGSEKQDRLGATTPEQAYRQLLYSGLTPPIRVHQYKRLKAEIDTAVLLEDVLEQLDEEYGDPEAILTKPTQKMIDAARVFAAAILQEYRPWLCEKTGKVFEFDEKGNQKEIGV